MVDYQGHGGKELRTGRSVCTTHKPKWGQSMPVCVRACAAVHVHVCVCVCVCVLERACMCVRGRGKGSVLT